MTQRPAAGFYLSTATRVQLEAIRQEYLRRFPDNPPRMLGLFWGFSYDPTTGSHGEGGVAVAYWRESEYADIAEADVVIASGVELVVGHRADLQRFLGRVLDYAPESGLFLRAPFPDEPL